jgi:hypothetical protein
VGAAVLWHRRSKLKGEAAALGHRHQCRPQAFWAVALLADPLSGLDRGLAAIHELYLRLVEDVLDLEATDDQAGPSLAVVRVPALLDPRSALIGPKSDLDRGEDGEALRSLTHHVAE